MLTDYPVTVTDLDVSIEEGVVEFHKLLIKSCGIFISALVLGELCQTVLCLETVFIINQINNVLSKRCQVVIDEIVSQLNQDLILLCASESYSSVGYNKLFILYLRLGRENVNVLL